MRRSSSFKAWFSPVTDKLYLFNTNLIHNEIAISELGIKREDEAFRKGYIRIYTYKNMINIYSFQIPDDRTFMSLQYNLKLSSFPAKIDSSRWEVGQDQYIFPKQSFFFANSIEDAKIIN